MRFHHTGIAVKSIEAAVAAYRPLFANISEPVLVASQGVRVCFVETGPDCYIELVEPASEESPLRSLLKKGISYYHNGYLVDDFDAAARELAANRCRPMGEAFASEAFGGRRCQFFMNGVFHVIEIIEAAVIETS